MNQAERSQKTGERSHNFRLHLTPVTTFARGLIISHFSCCSAEARDRSRHFFSFVPSIPFAITLINFSIVACSETLILSLTYTLLLSTNLANVLTSHPSERSLYFLRPSHLLFCTHSNAYTTKIYSIQTLFCLKLESDAIAYLYRKLRFFCCVLTLISLFPSSHLSILTPSSPLIRIYTSTSTSFRSTIYLPTLFP